MKIIYNNWFPFGKYKAINICGILFSKDRTLSQYEINHEKIHTEQIKELWYIGFYLWYIIEYVLIWFANFTKSQNQKYREISFEEEARNNQYNLSYLRTRQKFAWRQYLNLHSNE